MHACRQAEPPPAHTENECHRCARLFDVLKTRVQTPGRPTHKFKGYCARAEVDDERFSECGCPAVGLPPNPEPRVASLCDKLTAQFRRSIRQIYVCSMLYLCYIALTCFDIVRVVGRKFRKRFTVCVAVPVSAFGNGVVRPGSLIYLYFITAGFASAVTCVSSSCLLSQNGRHSRVNVCQSVVPCVQFHAIIKRLTHRDHSNLHKIIMVLAAFVLPLALWRLSVA